MDEGRIALGLPDGGRIDYPVLEAMLATERSGDVFWLSLVVSARPDDWTPDSGGPEPPTVEVSVRVAGPDPGAWSGREFSLPEERGEPGGGSPAWLYYDESYETLGRCVLSVGDPTGSAVPVRVVGRGTLSGCIVEVTGIFPLTGDGAASGPSNPR